MRKRFHAYPRQTRILFVRKSMGDKYREENGKCVMLLNITVNHCFVDGKRLSDVFKAVQTNFDDAENLLK
jgi:chloramphenicol O-acetyltransferase